MRWKWSVYEIIIVFEIVGFNWNIIWLYYVPGFNDNILQKKSVYVNITISNNIDVSKLRRWLLNNAVLHQMQALVSGFLTNIKKNFSSISVYITLSGPGMHQMSPLDHNMNNFDRSLLDDVVIQHII